MLEQCLSTCKQAGFCVDLVVFFAQTMKRFCLISLCFLFIFTACRDRGQLSELTTAFEASDSLETATYEEGIEWWRSLEKASPYVCVQTFGSTDAGLPLHLVVINTDRNFSREKVLESDKTIWLINNGIHPGEPDGIDASMLFARELLMDEDFEENMKDVCILIIPFYNVGGALDRNCCSRANQNGPVSYGFRGNSNNLDLNRDFIKADSKNAQSFQELFRDWSPDVYLETHVSNGADYQYAMTYLFSLPAKLAPPLKSLVDETMIPEMLQKMEAADEPMTPYVNVFGTTPDDGFAAFYDSPRYSTGFSALHQSIGLLTETHMLKPYPVRVEATRKFMHALVNTISENHEVIQNARAQARSEVLKQTEFPLDWELDRSVSEPLEFLGYEAYTDTSSVTGLPQLYYDRSRPWKRPVPYFKAFNPTLTVSAPTCYLVPSSREAVLDRLRWNGVEMELIEQDSVMDVTSYQISDYQTVDNPYEGHYLHSKTSVTKKPIEGMPLRNGEYYLVPTNQPAKRFIVEVLEPEAPDSYFNWNFFDEILQQKEWFSGYVFDQEASRMLEDDAELRSAFEARKASDSTFRSSTMQQLYFLYQKTDHYEHHRHKVYPVLRVE